MGSQNIMGLDYGSNISATIIRSSSAKRILSPHKAMAVDVIPVL
jgi:hypothetical protein